MGFHKNGNYPSEKIDYNNMIDCANYFNRHQDLFEHAQNPYNGWVILALQYFVHSGNLGKLDLNTPNSLACTESNTNSPTPYSAFNEIFNLIFIQPFLTINLIFSIRFQSEHAHWKKIYRNLPINQSLLLPHHHPYAHNQDTYRIPL